MEFLLGLPNGQRLIERAIDALREGRPVIQPRALDARRVADEVFHLLDNNGWRRIEPMRSSLESIASALGFAQCPPPQKLHGACRTPNTVLVVECDECEVSQDWIIRSARQMAQAPRSGGLGLWVVGDVHNQVGGRAIELSPTSAISRQDVRAYAAFLFVDRPGPGPTHYLEAVAREVSGPDYRLLERLSRCSSEELIHIQRTLCAMSDHEAPPPGPGQKWVSSVELVRLASEGDANAEAAFQRRIWKAQVQELLPAIDMERPKFLKQFAAQLVRRLATSESARDLQVPDDVEWGVAWHFLRGAIPDHQFRQLSTFRDCRNDLSHQTPLRPESLSSLFDAASIAFKQGWSITNS